MKNVKHYYALFKTTSDGVEVEFPDLRGCVTFGKNLEEASGNAEDVLAGWLGLADPKFIKEPSEYEELKEFIGQLTPVPVNEKLALLYCLRAAAEQY